jgi:hypothetical protein
MIICMRATYLDRGRSKFFFLSTRFVFRSADVIRILLFRWRGNLLDSFAKKQGLVGIVIEVKEPSLLSKTQTKLQLAP